MRTSIWEHAGFIRAKAAEGVPASAIARMIGRNAADVRMVTGEAVTAAPAVLAPSPRKSDGPPFIIENPDDARIVHTVAFAYKVTVRELVEAKSAKASDARDAACHALAAARRSITRIGATLKRRKGGVRVGIARHEARRTERAA